MNGGFGGLWMQIFQENFIEDLAEGRIKRVGIAFLGRREEFRWCFVRKAFLFYFYVFLVIRKSLFVNIFNVYNFFFFFLNKENNF